IAVGHAEPGDLGGPPPGPDRRAVELEERDEEEDPCVHRGRAAPSRKMASVAAPTAPATSMRGRAMRPAIVQPRRPARTIATKARPWRRTGALWLMRRPV